MKSVWNKIKHYRGSGTSLALAMLISASYSVTSLGQIPSDANNSAIPDFPNTIAPNSENLDELSLIGGAGQLSAVPVSVPPSQQPIAIVHHSLSVILDPLARSISVEDTITIPAELADTLRSFTLNSSLAVTAMPRGVQRAGGPGSTASGVGINSSGAGMAPATAYQLPTYPQAEQTLTIRYQGQIYDLAEQDSPEYAQSFSETTGIISEQGVYLNRASLWVPDFNTDLISFDMDVSFANSAAGWTAVSQGDSDGANSWRASDPMEEAYLIAAPFTRYSVESGDVEMLAYLRTPDSNLATKYLDATERYLSLYEDMLGEYPFSKFALVENFWETGYGMPSFTLLGEQIIRFPFILESSYPHEILHNWWGNGVYPDYTAGNWSEGLTAYLADHLFREMDGTGHEYRKEMLARYKNYVADENDFALSEFTSRNSAASQAVGYGKTLMLWHMLRLELGDELFRDGLRKFYQDFKFRKASFDDIALLFSDLSGRDLTSFFQQWVTRVGAPELSLSVEQAGEQARIMFAQVQSDAAYDLTVPVALFYAGEQEPQIYNIELSQKFEGVMAEDYANLIAVVADPYFDVFRTLDREETPPTVGELFGANILSFILPSDDTVEWRELAESFAGDSDAEILMDSDLAELPLDRSVWVLGRSNKFAEQIQEANAQYGAEFSAEGQTFADNELRYSDRSTVLIGRHPANSELALGWIHIDSQVALKGMIEKLPHYGKYSYLSFSGDEPTNDVKGIWNSPDSPLLWTNSNLPATVADQSWSLDSLPPLPSFASLPPRYLPERLAATAQTLSQPSMQGRGLNTGGIDRAAAFIAEKFRAAQLLTFGGSYLQRFRADLGSSGSARLSNVVGMLPGTDPTLAGQPVIVAAHYDHLGVDADSGAIHAGADDNASGVSVMLEVAAKMSASYSPARPIVFVAFSGEEAGLLGSQHFVANPPRGLRSEDFYAMINLDSVGRLEGRMLQVFATDSAYEWPFMAQGIGFTIGVESEFPAQNIASSDHVSFLDAGIPAIHLFSGTHADYHQPTDTADKLDLTGMSNVALWLEEAISYLADNPEPLRSNLSNSPGDPSTSAPRRVNNEERQASLGTVPDFAYSGPGIRISGVGAGGAAEAAGLQANDVLLRYNGSEIADMQAYSNLIRGSAAGDTISLDILRAGQPLQLDVVLQAR